MTEQDKQALIKHYCERDCGEAAKDCMIMPCHEIELIQEFPTTEADSDTISRQDIIQRLEYVIAHGVPNERGKHEMTAEAMLEAVKQLPPAQPERIRGHWICDISWSEGVGMGESYGHYWKCDKCGHLEQGDWGECGCNFCSNCGSDNREVTE